jgi:hypothetical protein
MRTTRSLSKVAASKQPHVQEKDCEKLPLECSDSAQHGVDTTQASQKSVTKALNKIRGNSCVGTNEARAGGRKRRQRSASPMPPPATDKRVRTNDHPGLIGKKERRARADMAADKAAKEAEAAIATATKERAMTELIKMEQEQETREQCRHKAVIRHQATTKGLGDTPAEDEGRSPVHMGVFADVAELIDTEVAQGDNNSDELTSSQDDEPESDTEMAPVRKVS